VIAGAVLGVTLGILSRIEETTGGFSVGISSNATWLAAAFLVGALQRGRGVGYSAAAGGLTLTIANVAYYGWIAATEPGVALTSVAGPPERWLALGTAGGACLAATGRFWVTERGGLRLLAAAPLAGVCITEGITAARGGPVGDGFALAVGVAFLVASGTTSGLRVAGGAVAAAVTAVAFTGCLEMLMP
jgi:hypothetical protein